MNVDYTTLHYPLAVKSESNGGPSEDEYNPAYGEILSQNPAYGYIGEHSCTSYFQWVYNYRYEHYFFSD